MASPHYVSASLAIAVGLVCYCSMAECKYTPAQWYANYDRISGPPKGRSVRIDEANLVGTIAKLHTGATTWPVDKYKKAIVDFFYDADELKTEHCSFEWFERMEKRTQLYIEIDNSPMTAYGGRLYVKNSKMCSEKFVSWSSAAIALSGDEISRLIGIVGHIRNPLHQATAGLQIAELFGYNATTSYENFKKAWASGPCGKVLDGIAKPSAEGAKLFNYVSGVKDRSKAASALLDVFDACKMLQNDRDLRAIYKYVRV